MDLIGWDIWCSSVLPIKDSLTASLTLDMVSPNWREREREFRNRPIDPDRSREATDKVFLYQWSLAEDRDFFGVLVFPCRLGKGLGYEKRLRGEEKNGKLNKEKFGESR